MKDILALVEENTHIAGRLYLLKVLAPEIAKDIKAGHFVMVKVSNSLDPMGRRAFAVADVRGDSLLIFYDLVGRGKRCKPLWAKGTVF